MTKEEAIIEAQKRADEWQIIMVAYEVGENHWNFCSYHDYCNTELTTHFVCQPK